MDFSPIDLDEKTKKLWLEFRAFLDDHVTAAVHEREWRTGDGFNPEIHKALGGKGWLTPSWPVEEGGIGATGLQCLLLAIEIDSHSVPFVTQMTQMLVAPVVRAHCDPELASTLVPGIARGDILICLGYTEPDAGSDLANVSTRAVLEGTEWVINGQKMFTTSAHFCQYVFLATRTDPSVPKHRGITMFMVPLDLPGVEVRAIETLGGERTNTVFLDEVRVPDRYRVGAVGEGWAVLNGDTGPLRMEHGGTAPESQLPDGRPPNIGFVSKLRRSLEIAIDWASREEGEGRAPIDDPSVRRELARILLDCELGEVARSPLSRVITAESLVRDTSRLIDLVGREALVARSGEGARADGWLEFVHRYAQGTTTHGGTVEVFRNMIAEQELGLPRGRPSQNRA